MSGHLPRFSPDTRKKKHALPSLLSNIRNAQAVIGRAAADESHDRETRPLVSALGNNSSSGGGGAGGHTPSIAPSNRPQLSRNAPSSSASFASTLQNFSQRFGSQWRKRSRRKKGQGVTVVPQSFFLAVGCFFFAFPFFFILYILARHAVFGDEDDNAGTTVHKHEVPSSLNMPHESGTDLIEMNNMDTVHPEDDIKMYNHLNLTSVHGHSATGSQIIVEGSDVGIVPPDSVRHAEASQIIGDSEYQNESKNGNLMQSNIDLQHASMHNTTRESIAFDRKDVRSSKDLKETVEDNPQQGAISLNNVLVDELKSGSTFDQVKNDEMVYIIKEKQVDDDGSKTNVKESSSAMEVNDVKLLRSREEND